MSKQDKQGEYERGYQGLIQSWKDLDDPRTPGVARQNKKGAAEDAKRLKALGVLQRKEKR